MALEPKIEFVDGKIVEYVSQEVAEDSFSSALDDAQNAVNTIGEKVTEAEAEYNQVVGAVEAASTKLEESRKEQEAAKELLAFQESRKAAYDEAVRLRDQVAGAEPAEEDSGDVADDAEFTGAPGESIDLPVTVAE